MRVLVGAKRPAQNQRERDQPHAGDVGAMIEARQTGARRHRDAELLPQSIAAELQLLDRRAEHVLDDDEAGVRRDDQPLGRDQSVRDIARVLVQHGDRGHQLPNEAERGVDIELQLLLLRNAQDVRQPRAFEMIGDDRERRGRRHRAIDAADAGVVGVPEVRQARGALAQRELERRDGESAPGAAAESGAARRSRRLPRRRAPQDRRKRV